MKILIAIIIFSAIILFHEFGHFLFAKLNGISVTEFSLGNGTETVELSEGRNQVFVEITPAWRLMCHGR